ncbi:MAG: transcription factor that binds to CRE motif [Candelina submexicana]|nr:MAG: transcription factor that binds to CRE motif [Candelina submexicana]
MNPQYSPADSMLSAPSDNYQSLFGEEATASPAELGLTPQSMKSDREDSVMSASQEGTETQQKKPTKKRKSWGQELPTPTTNLGPRKRAKTAAEKEQRRIERVLRNRAAAQTSRERKRLEVDQLEAEKRVTEDRNRFLEDQNRELLAKISLMAEQMTVFQKLVGGEQPTADIRLQDSPATLSADLLRSRSNSHSTIIKQEPEELDLSFTFRQATVDPRGTALSSPSSTPKLGPAVTTPNMTQHPAEVLCDLPCQLGVSRPRDPARTDEESLRQWMILYLIMLNMHLLYLTALSIASSTIPDFSLSEDGNSSQFGGPSGDTFRPFDFLVDLDADQSFETDDRQSVVNQPLEPFGSTDFPDQFAAQTSGVQPGFGAFFTRRDGQGIAADI